MPKEDARTWLSGDFVDLTFSAREKEALLTEHPMSSLKRGACFLLTGEEAAAYLDADALVAAGSVHAGTEEGRWWLNDADQPMTQCYVDEQGAIRLDGFMDMDWNGKHPSAGVRPACWVDLSLVGEETAALPGFALPCAQPGQLVTFGHYEQNNVTMDGAEPIVWLVLASRNGESLLLSRHVLAQQAMGSSAWADSPLRQWLGGAFRESAFTQEEVERYLPGAEERLTMRTATMVGQGTNGWIPQERSVVWLTRTMGSFSTLCTVSDSGDWLIRRHDQAHGNDNQFLNGIRPAIWLDLSLLTEDMVDASGRNQGEDSEAMALDALKEATVTALDSWAGDDRVTSSQPLLSAAGAEQNAERWRRALMEQLLTAAKGWVSEDVFDHFAKDGLLRAWDDYCEANMPSADGWSIWDAVAEDPVGVLVEPLRQLSFGPWDEAEGLRASQDMTAAAARIDLADIERDVWRRTQANLNEDGVTFVQYISQCAGKRLVNALMSATQLTGTEMAPSGLTADGAESLPLFAQYATCYMLTLAMDALYTDFSRMPYLSETEQRQLGSQYTSLRSGIVELQTAVMTDDLQADKLTACANDALLALCNTQEIAQRHPLNGLWKDIFAQWTAKLTDRGWSFDAAGQILQTAVMDGKVGQSLLNQLVNRDALKRAFQEENQKLEDGAEDALSLPEMDALAQRWQDAERVVNDPTVQALWKITGEIWEVGEELVVMTNQWENALESEDKVSMMVPGCCLPTGTARRWKSPWCRPRAPRTGRPLWRWAIRWRPSTREAPICAFG